MAFLMQNSGLVDILQKAFPLIPSTSSLQMLLNMKIDLRPEYMEVSATDLDHSIIVRNQISGEGECSFTINAKKLIEVARELHEGELSLDVKESILTIHSGGNFSCKIACGDATDFPSFPQISDSVDMDIPVSRIIDMVTKSSFAVSKDETRVCLCGVLWEFDRSGTTMVATDGHRLGTCSYQCENITEEKNVCIVSPKTLTQVVKLIKNSEKGTDIHVSLGDKYIVFRDSSFELISKLIDGPYPNYEKVIPTNNPRKCIVDRCTLIDAVRRVSVLSNQKTHLVKFVFKTQELEISVLNKDIGGEAHHTIPVDYDGEEHVVGFNAAYLTEILGIADTDRVLIEMNTNISACLIFPQHDKEDNYEGQNLFLIMPLRIIGE